MDIVNTILQNKFYLLKYYNVINNSNYYHQKISNLSIINLFINFKNYIFNLIKNKNSLNKYQIYLGNDKSFYFGLTILVISLLIDIFYNLIISSFGF